MRLVLTIAWRNIFRHKGKSIVIGIILFLGALLMTIGNGVLSGMNRGLEENILNRFTGHLVLISDKQEDDNVIFTPMGRSVEVISGYPKIKELLHQQPFISGFTPAAREFVMVLNEDGEPWMTLVLGVKFSEYQTLFHSNIIKVEGNLLADNDKGLLITTKQQKEFYDLNNFWIKPKGFPLNENNLTDDAKKNKNNLNIKDELVLMGFNEKNSALDIRLPIKGIVKFSQLNALWGHINVMDIESFRECFGWITASDNQVELSSNQEKLLESDNINIDELFGSEFTLGSKNSNKSIDDIDFSKRVINKTSQNVDVDSGTYNLVFIKIKDTISISKARKKLNNLLKEKNIPARVITWRQSAGQIADIAMIIRAALFCFVFFLFFVAIIIIMNTLSMAALERCPEIGMMRAVGAQKRFISKMFLSETAFLSFIFGGLGIIFGIIVTLFVTRLQLTTTNDMLQLFYGGDSFKPFLDAGDIIIGIIQLTVVTFLAVIYPIRVARKITPLDAISRD